MIDINSISHLLKLLECEKPKHPLIAAVDYKDIGTFDNFQNVTYSQNFYVISLKHDEECEIKYGRQYYDFDEGSLVFTAPGQILSAGKGKISSQENAEGWMLCIHPDLIKGTSLWHKMPEYGFFEYEANEALHLSEEEKKTIEHTIEIIKSEYSKNIDPYSKDLIISNLEVLLNFSNRFYNRQFITRININNEVAAQFDTLLNEQCSVDVLKQKGQPTVKELAAIIGYSPNYLSDMLKKATGKTTQEHIKIRVAELAESQLLTTNKPIHVIAEELGFDEPSSFTKFIKTQYGVAPAEFRKQRSN